MSVQCTFYLNPENEFEQGVLETLSQYPQSSRNKVVKQIVVTFAKAGLQHPGSNPLVAQNYPVSGSSVPSFSFDAEEPTLTTREQDTGMSPISINYDA